MFQGFVPGRYNTNYSNTGNAYNDDDAVKQFVLINEFDATGKQLYTVNVLTNIDYVIGKNVNGYLSDATHAWYRMLHHLTGEAFKQIHFIKQKPVSLETGFCYLFVVKLIAL